MIHHCLQLSDVSKHIQEAYAEFAWAFASLACWLIARLSNHVGQVQLEEWQHFHSSWILYLGVTPKSSILIGFSIINHPFGGPLFLETPI